MSTPEISKTEILKRDAPTLDKFAERYRLMLSGFQEFDLKPFILQYRLAFEQSFSDFVACTKCRGECNTSVYVKNGTQMYYGPSFEAMKNSGIPKVIFTAHICPGVTQRKLEIVNLLKNQQEESSHD